MSVRTEHRLSPQTRGETSHRDDLLAVEVLAARRDAPAPLAVRALGLALSVRGSAYSTEELMHLVNICLAAQTYSERIGLVETRVTGGDVRD